MMGMRRAHGDAVRPFTRLYFRTDQKRKRAPMPMVR
jgi:hypothetical protein